MCQILYHQTFICHVSTCICETGKYLKSIASSSVIVFEEIINATGMYQQIQQILYHQTWQILYQQMSVVLQQILMVKSKI